MSLWGAIGSIAGSVFGGPLGASIGGALGGAIDGSNAASGAQKSQQSATDAAIAEQRRQFDLQREDSAPYRAAGTQALGQLQTDINAPVTSADVMSDPGYQFGLDQGQRALNQKFAAAGGRISGASLKAANRFGTDYATTGYGAAYQRRQDRLNRLAAIAGIGQTSTAGSAQAGANSSNQISGLLSAQGNANAASQIAQGSIWGNTGNQLSAIVGRGNGGGGYNATTGSGVNFGGGGLGGFSLSDLINGTGLGGGL